MSKNLVIVESPTKAKTIGKFLGDGYTVLSSFGHVRDLPKSKIGVDPGDNFAAVYVIPKKAEEHVRELKAAAKDADGIILATDEDREGEAIAWHLEQALDLKKKTVTRIVFHEITKEAIANALAHPRALDMQLVHAQQARRILDRLVGYELSPFLWEKVQRGLSAGRVQSVALRLVVERERERKAFHIDEYWTIEAQCAKDAATFPAKLVAVRGEKLDKLSIPNKTAADAIVAAVTGASLTVASIERKEVAKAPPTPLTTAALQIAANTTLGMSAKQTMTLAQKLYETGRITYMRTDSLNLAAKFLGEAQEYITEKFGSAYATGAKTYVTKSKGAQEAHEAIRPTDVAMSADDLPGNTDAGTRKLYDLIWRRTLASQLPSAKLIRTSVDMTANNHTFRATGSSIAFDGFMRVYHAAEEKILPALKEGDAVAMTAITPEQHFTEPPARYSDAMLVKALEERGIGRPSTYAPTISTIIDRGYVDRDDQKKLFPNDIGTIVTDVLVEHFPSIVDEKFTATMEGNLDRVAEGAIAWQPMLAEFYTPFHARIVEKKATVQRGDIMKVRAIGIDPATGLMVMVQNGRFGPFVQLGPWNEEDKKKKINKPKSASLERGQSLDTITLAEALRCLELPRTVGLMETGETIIADKGQFGPYLRAGEMTASLPEEVNPRTVSLEDARRMLTENAARKKLFATPIAELGEDPESNGAILVKHGRFGAYVTDGTTNATIPKTADPATVTHDEAVALLAKKRASPKRSWGRKKQWKKK